MVDLQLLTGMRPGEATAMRTGDIDMSGRIWVHKPGSHKTEHHGRNRVVFIGPKAQQVLSPFLKHDLDTFIFSPADAVRELRQRLRTRRKTHVQPSQFCRAKPAPQGRGGTALPAPAPVLSMISVTTPAGVILKALSLCDPVT